MGVTSLDMHHFRNILLAAALALGSASAGAQGIVRFTNLAAGPSDGSGFLEQLYGGPAGSLEPVLVPCDPQASFMSDSSAGYSDGGLATNTFVLPGTTGTFQARAWSAGYAACEQASSAGLVDPNVLVGTSSLFENATGTSSYLTKLKGFSITAFPEMKITAYLLAGAALLVLRPRK